MRTLSNKFVGPVLGAAMGTIAFGSLAQAQDLKTINFISANDDSCSLYPQFGMEAFGYLQKEGYKINFLDSDESVPYVAMLESGDADIAMLDAAETLIARAAGKDIKVVYETHQFAPEGIVVTADSPIRDLSQLKGKTIGLAEQADEVTTQIALDSVGLTLADVTTSIIGNQAPVMTAALRDKTIDAFAGAASDRAAIETLGVELRNITPDALSRNPGNSLVVWGPTMEEKRPLIQAFTRAWAAAQAVGPLDIKAVIAVCRQAAPEQFENLDRGIEMIDDAVYIEQLRRTFFSGDLQADVWAAIQPGYMMAGVIEQEVDPATFLDTSFQPGILELSTEYVKEGIQAWKDANPDLVIK